MKTLALALWLGSTLAMAQPGVSTGRIQGSVTDSSGGAIPGATVAAQNSGTGARRTTRTDESGNFVLPAVAIGFWRVTAESEGFSLAQTEVFQVSVGQIVVRTIQLQPSSVVEKLEVRENPGAIETQASTASVALGYERIEEAPARSRNYLNFVMAAPGVAPSASAPSQRTMTGARTPLPDTGFSFGGMRARNNSIQIDGMDNRDETTGGNRVAVGLEMVQEFRVSAVAVGAELGGAAGGVLNMVTRSGVNLWHGDATWFMQNGRLNAARSEVPEPLKPRFGRYQPGVSAMGPLRRDRTFIAAAMEYEHETGDEFANLPDGVAFGGGESLYPTLTRGGEMSMKFDHQIGPADTLSVRYAFSRGLVNGEVQGPANFADRSAQGDSRTTDHSLVGSWMRVLNPTVVNDLRVQFGERSMVLRPAGRGPMFEVPGVITFGQYFGLDADRTERHAQVVNNFQFVAGAHRLSAGFDLHTVSLDSSIRNRYAGIYIFPTPEALLNRRPDVFIQAFGDPRTGMRTSPLGGWLQDRWTVRPDLTLEFGLRYDHQLMPAGLPRSSHNWSPRFGLAWRPMGSNRLVARAGAGLFYDRYPLAFLNDALQKDGAHGFEQYAAGDAAALVFARSGGGLLTSPQPDIPLSTYTASADFPSTYGRKLSAGIEYGLDANTSVAVELSTVHGFHLPGIRNALGRLPPRYLLEQTRRSSFTGGTVTLNRKLTREVAWLVSYSCGRTRDDASDFDEHPSNPLNLRQDWAPSRQDQRHRFAASALFELPAEGLSFLEDISLAPMFTVGSGRPLDALLTTDAYRTGAYPISARPAGMGRNPFLSSATVNLDIRVMKTIRVLQERALLQFGIESFNLLNHTNPERISQFYTATYGETIESLPARQIQLMVQFEF